MSASGSSRFVLMVKNEYVASFMKRAGEINGDSVESLSQYPTLEEYLDDRTDEQCYQKKFENVTLWYNGNADDYKLDTNTISAVIKNTPVGILPRKSYLYIDIDEIAENGYDRAGSLPSADFPVELKMINHFIIGDFDADIKCEYFDLNLDGVTKGKLCCIVLFLSSHAVSVMEENMPKKTKNLIQKKKGCECTLLEDNGSKMIILMNFPYKSTTYKNLIDFFIYELEDEDYEIVVVPQKHVETCIETYPEFERKYTDDPEWFGCSEFHDVYSFVFEQWLFPDIHKKENILENEKRSK